MFPASLLLLIGATLGAVLRLPAFMAAAVLILAGYGWSLRHHAVGTIAYELLVGLLAVECGYALTIVARLLVRSQVRRMGPRRTAEDTENSIDSK